MSPMSAPAERCLPTFLRRGRAVIAVLLLMLPAAAPALAETPEEQLAAASALFDARKYAEAAQKLDQFLAASPRHAKAGAAALALGRARAEMKQWDKAVPAYEKAVASKEASILPTAQLGLGEAAMQTRQWEKAAAALQAALKGSVKPEQAAVAWFWLGQASFQLERFPAAEEAYLKVTREHGKSDFAADAQFGAAVAALRQRKTEPARQHLRTLLSQYPKSEDRPQAMLLLAQIDLEAKRYREARAGFEALLQDPAAKRTGAPLLEPAEDGLIQSLLELQDYAGAAARLESALSRLPAADPQRHRAQLSLGHCRYRQKQYEPALASYREAARSTEGAVAGEGHYWAANAALGAGRPAEAAAEFEKVVARFPKHPLAPKSQLKAGDALLAAKQSDAAGTAYRKVVDLYPQAPEAGEARKALAGLVDSVNDPAQLAAALKNAPPAERARGTLRLARLHLQAKKYQEAVSPLTQLLQGKPEPEVAGEAQYLLGLAYEAQEKSAPAAAALAEAVRQVPAAKWALDAQGRLAWLYLGLKQPANAEKAAGAALSLKPEAQAERQARLAQVQAQLEQEKWDAVLEGCRALLAGSPPPETVATVLFTQAWVSEKRGKPEEALPLWERLASEHPRSEYAAEALLRVGDARLQAEKHEEARERYAALLTGFPKSPLATEARFKLGTTLYHLERFPEAAVELDRVAADKNAGDLVPEALYWAGVAQDKAGKKEDAIQRLSRLVNQYPKHARVTNAKIRLAALKAVK
jgi:TolA-binding protein